MIAEAESIVSFSFGAENFFYMFEWSPICLVSAAHTWNIKMHNLLPAIDTIKTFTFVFYKYNFHHG